MAAHPHPHPHMSESQSPTMHSTPRSSITALDREVQLDEARMETYGGDDPREPPTHFNDDVTRTPTPVASTPISEKGKQKADFVTWDGPDDPSNPQNWTRRKKWIITIMASVVTLNVYVSIFRLFTGRGVDVCSDVERSLLRHQRQR